MPGLAPRYRLAVLVASLVFANISFAATAEYRVKAAFLYKFATYVRWPGPPAASHEAFVIGVLGADPFGDSLDEVVRDQTVQGRAIRIRRITHVDDAQACDLVFVSASQDANVATILAALRDTPVLTVSDLEQFAEKGGMIGLVTTPDNHIRFDINQSAVERTGLKASSQLLHLARIVEAPRKRGFR